MKLPFSFSLKFAFRLLLPGFIVSIALLPILNWVVNKTMYSLSFEIQISLLTILLGWLFVLSDMQIYMLYEGRRYWPGPLKDFFLRSEERRLEELRDLINESSKPDDEIYLEASVEIRKFPFKESVEYYARYPTRIGNLIASFENYPIEAYGMSSIFYWPRIWLSLDDELRTEIDNQQAVADSGIYVSFAMYINAVISFIYGIFPSFFFHAINIYVERNTFFNISFFLILVGYVIYRISLFAQNSFGDVFKSVFDQYRQNVDVDGILKQIRYEFPEAISGCETSKEKYQIAWRYLQNNYIRINGENKRPVSMKKND